jgi:hypothetical protein
MTPEQIELPTVSNVNQDLQCEPDIREGYLLVGGPVKWVPYKPQGAKQMKRKGRWKAMNEYGGWDNCETPAQIWSGFISYEEMAAHTIAQREQIAALEARVKAADELAKSVDDLIAHSDGVSGLHNNGDIAPWSDLEKGGSFGAWLSALEDYRATGGQDNE